MTLADKEVWLQKQRTENKELSEAIQKQREVSFLVEDLRMGREFREFLIIS
ncbi:hypothetical protein ACFLV5_04310 [Chloroflexota bacterium]